ncbi:universal stress protein PHOS34-like isoform X2 [Humulus lupulus]|uniref:universal stress protein PHOS34-like isoform X2 n=1 Tax=Humulus lupulus TaxID=3486 RepID=UPI002B4073E8|nr:universal stress protein PHOS34-like isoform X2 [Humulus lupulus]
MATTEAENEKPVIVVGIDNGEHSSYALEWTLDHFFVPFAPNYPFKLILTYATPPPCIAVGIGITVMYQLSVESDLAKIAAQVREKGERICASKSVNDVVVEITEGDARTVLCKTVEKHHASILVVGSHGYGMKRVILGSVSDHCAHHAKCSVMIVKKPKIKH